MNRVLAHTGVQYPIVQAPMGYIARSQLASAVSNAGGLGIIETSSGEVDACLAEIEKMKTLTDKPFGVNVPLQAPHVERIIDVVTEERVGAVITSAGNPALYTQRLHEAGCKVAHVVADSRSARKCAEAGVDAVIAEGFEAGGHNGRQETATLVLVPIVRRAIDLPLIAAGGIATGEGMLAALALGADGVQIGTRFVMTDESSAGDAFKRLCLTLGEGDTMLALKRLSPTRLVKNEFYRMMDEAEQRGATAGQLEQMIGRGRAKRGMFDGDIVMGELEIGQAVTLVRSIQPAGEVVGQIIGEFDRALERLCERTM